MNGSKVGHIIWVKKAPKIQNPLFRSTLSPNVHRFASHLSKRQGRMTRPKNMGFNIFQMEAIGTHLSKKKTKIQNPLFHNTFSATVLRFASNLHLIQKIFRHHNFFWTTRAAMTFCKVVCDGIQQKRTFSNF